MLNLLRHCSFQKIKSEMNRLLNSNVCLKFEMFRLFQLELSYFDDDWRFVVNVVEKMKTYFTIHRRTKKKSIRWLTIITTHHLRMGEHEIRHTSHRRAEKRLLIPSHTLVQPWIWMMRTLAICLSVINMSPNTKTQKIHRLKRIDNL